MSSNPRVTITLGRSGQVVTKEGKQPSGEGSWMSSSKRHRGDRMKWSPGLSGEKVHPTSSRSNEAPMSYRTPSRPSSSSQYNDLRPPTYPEEYASGNGITYSSQFAMGGSRRASAFMQLHEHVTVADFLHSLGLGKYCISFQAEEVDMAVLKQMGEKDLKDMGIPMGPRKKILLALLPPPKKRAS
ncbi:unnamed protein product [Linum tenue]|uniref:SAM domain-containing protein n=1 Tax=Linum tenue TaxID=586396 RepID=A0AAV0NAF7_9ROSI|nr:unnamed protein product [Linum tenue]